LPPRARLYTLERLGGLSVPRQKEAYVMLSWAVVFLVVALLAAVFGFSGIAGTASNIAWILFVVFLIIAVISFLSGRTRVL
jgi:uncharacterized membrane protein YtjA (UPF0391 family)